MIGGSHSSYPYNPSISYAFFKSGFIESWGSGFEKIKENCNMLSNPLPIVEKKGGGIWVTCNPSKTYLESLEKIVGTLNEIEKGIINCIAKNNYITTEEISDILDSGLRTIRRYTIQLQERGYIKRIGSKKTGYWKILK